MITQGLNTRGGGVSQGLNGPLVQTVINIVVLPVVAVRRLVTRLSVTVVNRLRFRV